MEPSPPAVRTDADAAARVLAALFNAQRALRLYPATNPQVGASLERLRHLLDRSLAGGALVFEIERDRLASGGKPVASADSDYGRLAFKLHCLNVGELELRAGLGSDELVALIRLLNLPYDTLRGLGPLDASLAARGVTHVGVRFNELVVPGRSTETAVTSERPLAEPAPRRVRPLLNLLLDDPGQFARELVRLCVEVVPEPGQRRFDAQLNFVDRYLQNTAAAIDGEPAERRPDLYEKLSVVLTLLTRSTDVSGARMGGLPRVDLTHIDQRVLEVLPERDLVKEVSSKVKLHQGATTVMASALRGLKLATSSEHTNPVLKVIESRHDSAQSVASNIQVLEEIRVGADVDGEYPGIAYAERDRNKNFALGTARLPGDIGSEERREAQRVVAALDDWRPAVDVIETQLDMLFNEHNPNFLRAIAERLVEKLGEFLDRGEIEPALAILRGLNVERRQRRDDPLNLPIVEAALGRIEEPDNLGRLLRFAETLPVESEAFEKVKAFFFLLDKRVVHALVDLVAGDGGRYSRRRLLALAQYLCKNRLEVLAEGLRSNRAEAVKTFVWLLGHFGREAIPHLRRAAHHPEARVRREAVRGLSAVEGEEATRALGSLLADRDGTVVSSALRALVARGGSAALPPLEALLAAEDFTDRSEEVTLAAVRAAARLGGPSTVAALRRIEERGRLRLKLRTPALAESVRSAIREIEDRSGA